MGEMPVAVPIAVKVYPINVGQGDAILLEVKYDDDDGNDDDDASFKRCLIDGGRGQKEAKTLNKETVGKVTPFNNLITALDDCISEAPESTSSGGKTWKDRSYRQIRLDSIVITHPDADHHGGINALLGTGSKEIKLGAEKFTVCCPVITTSAASLYVEVPKGKNGHRNGEDYSSAESDCPHFWFQQNALGRRHTGLEDLHQRSTVTICKSPTFQEDFNATSILTTVKLPGANNYDYDVVLTGDSYGGIILDELGLRSKEGKRKTVGVFQVPHHGSKKNSTMASKKGEGSYLSCYKFYMQFDADIYLISHGDHKGYDHPHSEVITGILSAAVQKKQDRKCKIVVTATQFKESKIKIKKSKIKDDINWRDYVDILYFKKGIPYVTLDPNDPKVPDGLELFPNPGPNPKTEEDDQEGPSSHTQAPNKSEETPIKEYSRSRSKRMNPKASSLNPESDERVDFIQSSQDQGHTNPATLAEEVGIKSHAHDCTVCGKQTGPTCVVTCRQCSSRAHANKVCTHYARASTRYLCEQCRTCNVCNELTHESGTSYTAVCVVCKSRAHANAETNCTQYNKANKASKKYICGKCRTYDE